MSSQQLGSAPEPWPLLSRFSVQEGWGREFGVVLWRECILAGFGVLYLTAVVLVLGVRNGGDGAVLERDPGRGLSRLGCPGGKGFWRGFCRGLRTGAWPLIDGGCREVETYCY